MTIDDDEAVAASLEETAAHESGHVRIAQLEEAEIEWARVKQAGTGRTQIKDQDSLPPLARARIAVAGSVAEEVLLDEPRRDLPPSDRVLLARALQELDDPTVTEETLRADVRLTIEAQQREVDALRTVLAATPNANVSGEELMKVVTQASRPNS